MQQPAALPQPPSVVRTWLRRLLTAAAVVAVYVWAFRTIHIRWERLAYGLPTMFDVVRKMTPPNWSHWSQVSVRLYETLRIAVLSASFGAVIALPVSLLTARNIVKSNWIYQPARFVLNLIRTLPDMVLAAIAVGIFGIGAVPGIIAMSIFAGMLIAKLLSESVEAIDAGPLEALAASGANGLQRIVYAVMPQVFPTFLSYTLYALEINVRGSFVLGLVGAGGVGMQLDADLTFLRYDNVAVIVVVIFVAVMLIDFVSTKLRELLV